jgi:hypothetical protein
MGNGAYEGEMNEVALFESALRVAVPMRTDPLIEGDLVSRLAQAARAASIEAETRASRRGGDMAGHRALSRFALVARVGIAVALIPLVLAGLAFAGFTVPAPARDAFDAVGITLPNQPSEAQGLKPAGGGTSKSTGNEVSDAAKSKTQGEQGNSTAAHDHALKQRDKAKATGEAIGHDRGKAIGLKEATPPGKSGDTGPPAHSNQGGSAQSQSVRKAPKFEQPKSNPHPFQPGQSSRGH